MQLEYLEALKQKHVHSIHDLKCQGSYVMLDLWILQPVMELQEIVLRVVSEGKNI